MISGVICEFNPFHNGHKYLLESAKKHSDYVVCVMSGNFTQRGEISLIEKHARAKMAIKNGADIVIDLPVGWSMAGAENFALGGVSLLHSTNIVDNIVFGCEDSNIEKLMKTASLLKNENILETIKTFSATGITFAKAREKAFESIAPECAEILKKPNNILAVQYIHTAIELDFNCTFSPVSRIGAEHDSFERSDIYASASYIRENILNGNFDEVKNCIPDNITEDIIQNKHAKFDLLEKAIMFKLRSLSLDDFKKLPDVSEGIENRIFEQIKYSKSFSELIDNVKTKRYTMARIRRLLMSAAFGIDNSYSKKKPPYIKILAYSINAEHLVSKIVKHSDLPVIINTKDIEKLNDFGKIVFENQNMTTNLYSLAFDEPIDCGTEYTLPIIKI